MKKWIGILLIIVAAVVWMGACAPASEPEVVVVEREPTEAEAPAAEEPAAEEQEVIQVVVWATNDYEEEAYYALVDRFQEANPDIRVELTVYR